MLADKLPEVLDFSKDLASLEAASKVFLFVMVRTIFRNFFIRVGTSWLKCVISIQIQMRVLAEEMQAISKGLEKVVQELSTSEIDGPVSENFRKVFKLLVFFCHY